MTGATVKCKKCGIEAKIIVIGGLPSFEFPAEQLKQKCEFSTEARCPHLEAAMGEALVVPSGFNR
jgi:hypothetical protein